MADGWLVGSRAFLAHFHVLWQRDRHEPVRLQSAVEGSYILGYRDLNPVVDPHPRPVLENPEHVVLLLQRLGIDLGPEVSRTGHKRVSLVVQVRRVINGRFQVLGDWVAANEKYLAVFHRAQVVILRHRSGRRKVRNRLRASREQRQQHHQSQQRINASYLSNETHRNLPFHVTWGPKGPPRITGTNFAQAEGTTLPVRGMGCSATRLTARANSGSSASRRCIRFR